MFYPAITNLGQTNQYKNVLFEVSYIDEGTGISYPVTLTASTPNSTIVLNGGIISGQYSGVFNLDVKYRTVDNGYGTATQLGQVPAGSGPKIYSVTQTGEQFREYQYTATANGQSQVYSVYVLNDYTSIRSGLVKIVNPQYYADHFLASWVNNANQTVIWTNNSNTETSWEKP